MIMMIAVTLWMATKMTTMTMIFVEKITTKTKLLEKTGLPISPSSPQLLMTMTRMMSMTTLIQNLFRDGPESPYHRAPTFTDGR